MGEPVTGEGPGKAEALLKDIIKSNFVLLAAFLVLVSRRPFAEKDLDDDVLL